MLLQKIATAFAHFNNLYSSKLVRPTATLNALFCFIGCQKPNPKDAIKHNQLGQMPSNGLTDGHFAVLPKHRQTYHTLDINVDRKMLEPPLYRVSTTTTLPKCVRCKSVLLLILIKERWRLVGKENTAWN